MQLRVGRVLRAADVLHGKTEILGVIGVRSGSRFQEVEQSGAVVPAKLLAAFDDHVAIQGRHRDEGDIGNADFFGKGQVVGLDFFEDFLRVIDQIHFVDGDDDVRNIDQVRQIGVAARLRQHAFARINEDDRQVGGRGGGDHVARVLLVAGGIGNDVFARAGGEITVSDVDGNALFALGLQTVGEQREVDGFHAALLRGALDGVQRVDQDGLGVVEQAADQRALAVIDAAAGEKAQQAVIGKRIVLAGRH